MKQSILAIAAMCLLATPTNALSCNYGGQMYMICTRSNGWGNENGSTCIGISQCIAQSPPYGVVATPPNTPPPTAPGPTTPRPTTQSPNTPTSPSVAKSPGCGKSAPFQSGVQRATINGKTREYIVKLPSNYNPNNAYRLIFTFHWLNGNMNAAAQNAGGYYGLEAKAQGSAIFVSPNGLNAGWANQGGEDIAFVDEILKVMDNGFCINQNLRFATGFSFGGAMSHSVACSRPDKFRAVSVIAGALLSGCNGGNKPVAYQHMHGIHDSVLNISMGRSIRDNWVKVNGCTPQNPREPSQGSGTHITTEYQGCSSGHPVVWIAHDGDHVAEPADRGQGNFAPEATWKFFSRFN